MNIVTSNIIWDVSCSDNSHIFGRPIQISEGWDGDMDIPILNKDGRRSIEALNEWIEKTMLLEKAGIEMHLHYVEEEK